MSTTMHLPEAHVRRPHVNPWLVAVIGLAAALVALGSWAIVDRSAGGGGATQDATSLIDKSAAAFSTGDANAIPSYYASNVVVRTIGTPDTYTGVNAVRALADGSFTVQRIAPVTVNGDYAMTFIKLGDPATGQSLTSFSVFQIKNGKIVRQWNFTPGQTAPFENALP